MSWFGRQISQRRVLWFAGGLVLATVVAGGVWIWNPWAEEETEKSPEPERVAASPETSPGREPVVRVSREQQKALGVETAEVQLGEVSAVLEAPGIVRPDESQYAFITPRAEGIVRSVSAQIGQYVQEGDLLARIDSTRVAQARLDLIDALQQLEIARAKLNWQETVYQNSLQMIEDLQKGLKPEEIQQRFEDRPVGQTREELLKAYAQYYLSNITRERYENLQEKDAVPLEVYQEKKAQYEVDLATFQGLMDRMSYEVTLDYTQARQALREARTSVKVARETLRVLGVSVDEIVEQFETGDPDRGRSPGQTQGDAGGGRRGGDFPLARRLRTDGGPWPPGQHV